MRKALFSYDITLLFRPLQMKLEYYTKNKWSQENKIMMKKRNSTDRKLDFLRSSLFHVLIYETINQNYSPDELSHL